MEITLIRRMTLRARLEHLMAWYGDEAGIKEAAARGDFEAESGLLDLAILEEAPEQLDVEQKMEEVFILEPEEFAQLTPARWRLMEAVAPGGLTLADLGRRLGRDKKNISQDIRVLKKMGLLMARREGRTKRVWLRGDELRLTLPSPDDGERRQDEASAS